MNKMIRNNKINNKKKLKNLNKILIMKLISKIVIKVRNNNLYNRKKKILKNQKLKKFLKK